MENDTDKIHENKLFTIYGKKREKPINSDLSEAVENFKTEVGKEVSKHYLFLLVIGVVCGVVGLTLLILEEIKHF